MHILDHQKKSSSLKQETHSFYSQDMCMKRTISKETKATCCSGHIASNHTGAFGAQIQWHHVAKLLYVLVQMFQYTASLTGKDA